LRSSLRRPRRRRGVLWRRCDVVRATLCIWAAAAATLHLGGGGGWKCARWSLSSSLPLLRAASLSTSLSSASALLRAGCLRLVVACLELPEREKERREAAGGGGGEDKVLIFIF
jgi:hypothetical protein